MAQKKKWGSGFNGLMVVPAIVMTPFWLAQGAYQTGRKAGRGLGRTIRNGAKPFRSIRKSGKKLGRKAGRAGRQMARGAGRKLQQGAGQFRVRTTITGNVRKGDLSSVLGGGHGLATGESIGGLRRRSAG